MHHRTAIGLVVASFLLGDCGSVEVAESAGPDAGGHVGLVGGAGGSLGGEPGATGGSAGEPLGGQGGSGGMAGQVQSAGRGGAAGDVAGAAGTSAARGGAGAGNTTGQAGATGAGNVTGSGGAAGRGGAGGGAPPACSPSCVAGQTCAGGYCYGYGVCDGRSDVTCLIRGSICGGQTCIVGADGTGRVQGTDTVCSCSFMNGSAFVGCAPGFRC